jgi:hypothetical protein
MHNYHDVFNTFPYGAHGDVHGSWVRSLLPYIEQAPLYSKYNESVRYEDPLNLPVTTMRLPAHQCPSDTPTAFYNGIMQGNYAVNLGNTTVYRISPYGGVTFNKAPFEVTNLRSQAIKSYGINQVSDGTSNTLMLGEVRQGQNAVDLRGLTWWGRGAGFTTYNPPNSSAPDYLEYCPAASNTTKWPCLLSNGYDTGTQPYNFSARSVHVGGVQVTLCDGSVRFISENIDITTWRNLSGMQEGQVVGDF